LNEFTKWIGRAKIVDPSLVKARCELENGEYHDGAIYCEVPEMGFLDPNLIYCRYGLSIPYLKVAVDRKLLLEPTVNGEERFFYTGFADSDTIGTTDTDELIIQLTSQIIYASTAGVLYLSKKTASESFVLGDKLKTYIDNYIDNRYNTHTHPGTTITAPSGGGLCTGNTGAPLVSATKPTDILSTKIKGE